VSGFDKLALPDEALEAWLAVKVNRRPLVRTMSALDGFATAALTGPPFPDPQYWICPAVGLPYDVLTNGTDLEIAVFASVAVVHNRINETFFNVIAQVARERLGMGLARRHNFLVAPDSRI
jgi:hypothetical protein